MTGQNKVIDRQYWHWRWIVLVLVLSSAAYLFAHWASPAEQVFLGFLANNDDNQLYLSYMREGAQGAWLTTIRFTPEAHDPALLLPLYQLLGKVARLLGWSNEGLFHLARLIGGVVLLLAVERFLTLCLTADPMRRSAFLLACFSSGLGWLLIVARLADTVIVPVDIRVPEANTFLTIFTSPHFVLGVLFEILTLSFYLRAGEQRGALLASALSLLFLSITLVYNVIVLAAVLIGYTAFRCVQEGKLWIPELWRTIAVGLPCAPVVLYYVVLLKVIPFWRVVYGEHDVVHTPSPLALVLGYGLVFAMAVWGLVYWVRERRWSPPRALLATWFVGNGLLLYAPLAFQGKLMAGWHVGMCALAAVGLHRGALPWLSRRPWFQRMAGRSPDLPATARNVILILTIPSTLLVSLIGFRVALLDHYFPYFLPTDDVGAVHWLAAHSGPETVLLSSYGIGNYWVAHSEGRAFLGHQFAVLDPTGKDRAMRRFYSPSVGDRERRDLVERYGITHLFYGTLERELGDWNPDEVPWLELIWRQGATSVYRVRAGP